MELHEELTKELETPRGERPFGSGWLSGVWGFLGGIACLAISTCMLFPDFFTMPELRTLYTNVPVRLGLQGLMLLSFGLSILSLVLRENKLLGYLGLGCVLLAGVFGNLSESLRIEMHLKTFFGLDWFLLNMAMSGLLFIPIERLNPRWKQQTLFRTEWREDLFYFFVSSMMVQIFTFLSLFPATFIKTHTSWTSFRAMVGSQPLWLQFLEIMFLTDLVQYWCHRTFHVVPQLWRFHSVHHSAQTMDWMAGARMHVLEIVILRGLTVIPMQVLGYANGPIYAYILMVYFYSTFIHANLDFSPKWLENILVTPRHHHWHHGIEKEAIDVNFAIHFPILDRLFGTLHLPEDRWPSGYGIGGHPVPHGYWQQFLYPFKKRKKNTTSH